MSLLFCFVYSELTRGSIFFSPSQVRKVIVSVENTQSGSSQSSTSSWHVTAINRFFVRRIAFCVANEPIRATVLSTTLVNSSNTNRSLSSSIARARSHRIFSPFDRTWYDFSHDGTLAKPTLVSVFVISDILALFGISSRKHSCVYSNRSIYASGNNSFAIVVLPVPLAPTIRPTCQLSGNVISP